MRRNNFFSEDGIALMMTLWMMVLLIAIVTEFTHATRTGINTTKNFKEDIESYYLAEAGINLAITEILQDAEFHALDQKNEEEIVFGRKNFTTLADTQYRKEIKLGNGWFSYFIKDDNGKLNLNILPRETIIKVLESSGISAGKLRDTITDSILDWRDQDSFHRFNGAEDDYYSTLSPPYKSKNDFFDSIEELLWVKGMTEEILYGSANLGKRGSYLGIYDLLTVQNIEFINPNTADIGVLEVLYPSAKVEKIMSARKTNGRYDYSKSTHFIVESTGFLNNSNTNRTIKAVFEKISHGSNAFTVTKYWNNNKIK